MLKSIIRRYNSFSSGYQYFVKMTALFVSVITIGVLITPRKKPVKYTIYSTRRAYQADTFRIYGRGIVFEDVNGNSVILQGEIDIVANKTEE